MYKNGSSGSGIGSSGSSGSGIGSSGMIKITKDLYNDKKYCMKISVGGSNHKTNYSVFFKLLSRLGGFVGLTTNKEYDSAFFYVKEDFWSLRGFLKRIVNSCGYGSVYSETCSSGYGCISYDQAVFMADSLCRQVILFANYGWGFYCFLLDNVYVIDNHKFVYLGIEHLIEVKNGSMSGEKIINFAVPFPEKMMIMRGGRGSGSGSGDVMNLFICQEIKDMNRLPFRIMYSATYYHLASLIIYCMFHKNICFSEDGGIGGVWDGGDALKILSVIVNTKLYYFLIRCLHNEPSKRILLWV
jgi:hypothetical protein